MATLGRVAFVVGVLFAICGGIWGGTDLPTNRAVIAILLVAGLIIGLLNITTKEATAVLLATTALVILSVWGVSLAFWGPVSHLSQGLAENVVGLVGAFALLMAPAAIIVALKTVIAVARPD